MFDTINIELHAVTLVITVEGIDCKEAKFVLGDIKSILPMCCEKWKEDEYSIEIDRDDITDMYELLFKISLDHEIRLY